MTGIKVGWAGEKGRGVFATQIFEEGDIVETCPVIPLVGADFYLAHNTALTDYVFMWDNGEGCCIALGYGCLYNHEEKDFNAYARRDEARGVIDIRATRRIEQGDEITIHYGYDLTNS